MLTSGITSRAVSLVGLLLGGSSLGACAAIWGFQDSIGDAGAPMDGSTRDGASDGGRDSRQEARAEDAYDAPVIIDAPPPSDAAVDDPCSPPAPETYAIYVSEHEGNDMMAGCGDLATPCKTITQGLKNARTRGATIINVAQGTYAEQVAVSQGGFAVVGGWLNASGKWARDTSSSANADAIIKPNIESMTVAANSLTSPLTLCDLTIESKDAADAGETLYGVFATGGTTLNLTNVIVKAGVGGNGAAGAGGKPGAPGASAGCDDAGSGGMGSPVGTTGSFGNEGTFTDMGYQPGNGVNGGPGATGDNGTLGGAGNQIKCVDTCLLSTCIDGKTHFEDGGTGLSGCAGGGGEPGTGGGGGGSSVGVFAWGATVTLVGSEVTTAGGGNGAAGGSGGDGGAGSKGEVGLPGAPCNTACKGGLKCAPSGMASPTGGTPGGNGGNGSAGGAGGGGSGGFTCPIVRGGGAKVALDASTLMPSSSGVGASGAPSGNSGDGGVCSF